MLDILDYIKLISKMRARVIPNSELVLQTVKRLHPLSQNEDIVTYIICGIL